MVMAAGTGRIASAADDDGSAAAARAPLPDDKRIRVNYTDIFKSVQSVGASAFTGKDKKVWEAKQLAALGVKLEHKEKMPLKMWLGVSKARKERAAKRDRVAAEAGLVGVRPRHAKAHVWRGGGDDDGEGGGGRGQPADLHGDNVRGPVMHIRPGSGPGGGGGGFGGGGDDGGRRGGGGFRGGRGGGRGGFGGGRGRGRGGGGGRGRGGGGRGRGRGR